MITGWKAWFITFPEQHTILRYSSEDTDYEDLPRDGCLGFVLYEENLKSDGMHKRGFRTAHDYYFKAGDIYGTDVEVRERNTPEEISSRYVNPYIIRGIWTSHDIMAQVHEEMAEAEM